MFLQQSPDKYHKTLTAGAVVEYFAITYRSCIAPDILRESVRSSTRIAAIEQVCNKVYHPNKEGNVKDHARPNRFGVWLTYTVLVQ